MIVTHWQLGIPYLQEATEERDVIGPFLQCGVEQ